MKPSDPEAWENLKNRGEDHYKTGDIEPIDLYLAGDMLRDFAIASGIKYLYRNRRSVNNEINIKDINKVIHYCQMLLAVYKKKS